MLARRTRPLRPIVLAVAIAAASGARADAFTFRIQPGFVVSDLTTSDPAGRETEVHASTLTQLYYLTLDRTLFPRLRLSVNGSYQLILGSTSQTAVQPSQNRSDLWNFGARLAAGDEVLNASLFYNNTRRSAATMTDGLVLESPTFESTTIGLNGAWKPLDLPQILFTAFRDEQHDLDRARLDTVSDRIALGGWYQPTRNTDVRLRGAYVHQVDRLGGGETSGFQEAVRLAAGSSGQNRRVQVSGNYSLDASQSTTSAPGGQVRLQRYATRGLSLVEPPTAQPTRVTLATNGLLIDGDTAAGAGIGLNLGYAPSVSGDTARRDMGAQFSDAVTPVNLVYLWVNKPLTASVAGAITFSAYRSDDNVDWIPVPLAGAVAFALFENRFEIPIPETSARYLKVVARPLALGVTTDPAYADILVTEIQFFDVVASGSSRRVDAYSGFLSGGLHVDIVPNRFYYDGSASLTHNSRTSRLLWGVSNALSYQQRFGDTGDFSARIDRNDSNTTTLDHVSQTAWSAGVSAAPIPALGGSLAYTGQLGQGEGSERLSNSVVASGRAGLYQGVALYAALTWTNQIALPRGRSQESETAALGLALTPNAVFSINGNVSASRTLFEGGGAPTVLDRVWRADGSASFSPAPALALAATVSYGNSNGIAQTLYGFSGSLSPFPGGSLILTFRYNENGETLTQGRSRVLGPYLRWNISRIAWVESAYTYQLITTPTQDTTSSVFSVNLSLTL